MLKAVKLLLSMSSTTFSKTSPLASLAKSTTISALSDGLSFKDVSYNFDIIVNVYAKNLEALHDVVIEKIGKIDGIQNTETFVELQKTDKDPVFLIE